MLESGPVLDRNVISDTLGSQDPILIAEFYQLFLSHTGSFAESFALAHQAQDFFMLRRHAHQLKSSAAAVGTLALVDSLRQLELAAVAQDEDACTLWSAIVTKRLLASCEQIEAELVRLQQDAGGVMAS